MVLTRTCIDRDVPYYSPCCDIQHLTFVNSFERQCNYNPEITSHSLLVELSLPLPAEIVSKIRKVIVMFKLGPYASV